MSKYKTDEYRLKNKERMRDTYNTEEGKSYDRQKKRTPSNRFSSARRHAARKFGKSRKFELTRDQYIDIITRPCYYCNKSLSNETGIGLDRKDNDGDYTIDNVNACCGDCNSRRGDSMDAEVFKEQSRNNGRWKDTVWEDKCAFEGCFKHIQHEGYCIEHFDKIHGV